MDGQIRLRGPAIAVAIVLLIAGLPPGWSAAIAKAEPLLWTADGVSLGGSGAWTTTGLRWTATTDPVTPVAWADAADAVFVGNGGTVTLEDPITAGQVVFDADLYTLDATGGGSLSVSEVSVTDLAYTTTLQAALGGTNGFRKSGSGLLILGDAGSDYSGATSVLAGRVQSGRDHVLPDATLLFVDRFAEYDFSGTAETIAGISGEGTIALGSSLTVEVPDADEVRFDGELVGDGDFIIDSLGQGTVRFDTSANTKAAKLEKAYSGRTLLNNGTLIVDTTATPTLTSGVEIAAGGRLMLATDDGQYTFGTDTSTVITLAGGTLSQEADTVVLLANAVEVTADSTVAITNTTSPDPVMASAEGIMLTGPLRGSLGTTLTLTSTASTPGADTARVVFAGLAGNTYAGTVRPQLNTVARIDGVYSSMHVQLDGGTVDGSGLLKSIAGSGTVAPVGVTSGDGILTAESVTVAADTAFEFGFSQVNGQPDWFYPTASLNDGLRLTGNNPLPVALGVGNRVQLFLQVAEIVEDDAFFGGFLTRQDATSLITHASFETYVLGDGKGIDAVHNGIGFYTLDNFNAVKGIDVEATVSMKQVSASFNGLSKEPAFLMQAIYAVPTGPVVVDVASGTTTQSAAGHSLFSGTRGLTKTGGGELVLDRANTHTGTTTVSAGTLAVTESNALASSPTVVSGGRLEVTVDATIPSLAVERGSAALTAATRRVLGLETLAIEENAGGGLLDLGRGRVDIASGGISPADLRAAIIAGRNDGSWDGFTGITSSTAAADSQFGVGYVIDATSGAASVAWAALGDSNLDGLVNFDDIIALFPNYNANGSFSWQEGDFTYDGLVNFDDIIALFPNYNAPDYLAGGFGLAGGVGASGFAGGFGAGDDELLSLFIDDGGNGVGTLVSVPEPSGWRLLLAGLTGVVASGVCSGRWLRCQSRKEHRQATGVV